ncbi:MAG: DUF723 domain-containing protein [Campylobacterota bacterium]|nr:DUF723 domain-containing protein [Campylobacterota bacterium]
MPKMMTTEQWIEKSKVVWGNIYTYTNTEYRGTNHKVAITCSIHGDFEVYPGNHLTKGSGCNRCSNSVRRTTETFIEEAIEKFGDQYDYSKVVFKRMDIKVTITCKDHGEFEITPEGHLTNAAGCPKCGHKLISVARSLSESDFIARVTEIHNGKYTYSDLVYTGIKDKVEITCPNHGNFWQTADNHLHLAHGCPKCYTEFSNSSEKHDRYTTEQFIQKAVSKFGDKYNYSKVKYFNTKTHISIICPEHGEFTQRPSNHLTGYEGCPECLANGINNGGFNRGLPGICYLMKFIIDDQLIYKVGITNRTVQERYSSSEFKHCIEAQAKAFNVGKDAHTMEQTLLKKYKQHKYEGDPILKSGNTELLVGPIGGLEEEWL